jgi:hypothetical protein
VVNVSPLQSKDSSIAELQIDDLQQHHQHQQQHHQHHKHQYYCELAFLETLEPDSMRTVSVQNSG